METERKSELDMGMQPRKTDVIKTPRALRSVPGKGQFSHSVSVTEPVIERPRWADGFGN